MHDLPDVVAEIGLNHNGSVDIAVELIEEIQWIAKKHGYPPEKVFYKFQKRSPRDSTPRHMWSKVRVSPVSGMEMPYIEYKEEIEFGRDDYDVIDGLLEQQWFASVWDVPSVDFIANYYPHVPYLKTPSAHLTNTTLIKECIATGIPVIISTAMSTEDEIKEAIRLFSLEYPLTVLACTATYPCPDEEVHLRKISLLSILLINITADESKPLPDDAFFDMLENVPLVGYSSHSPSPFPAIYAALKGASMVEVHVTLDRTMPGSDHAASLELPAVELLFRELIRQHKIIGPDDITVFPGELDKRKSLRGL